MANNVKIFLAAGIICAAACAVQAQDTNALNTRIGQFENRTGVVIVKGYGQVGSIPVEGGELLVRCKETSDSNGQKMRGLLVEYDTGESGRTALPVDDDEVDALLKAINSLSRINNNDTSLPGFEATYTTRANLRIIALGSHREGSVSNAIQFASYPPIALSPTQMTQLSSLIAHGQKSLEALKAGTPSQVQQTTQGSGY